MPKNKFQGFIFGLIMSYAMAYGMEVYNVAIKEGIHLSVGGFSNMTNLVFGDALKETCYMGLFVLLFSNLWGNRLGAAFASRHCNLQKVTSLPEQLGKKRAVAGTVFRIGQGGNFSIQRQLPRF